MSKPTRRFLFASVALVAAFFLLAADDALARAGGGHSSGGGHSFGGSGGSGGSGDLVWMVFQVIRGLVWLDLNYPIIGLPVTAGVIYIGYRISYGGQTLYQVNVIRRGARAADRNLIASGLRQLRANDAAFDLNAFCARARDGFTKLQRAWCEQSLTAVRPFISDGINERFSLQFDEQRALGYRPVMESLNITEITPAQVERGPVFDVITLRIGASANDYRVSVATGRAIPGSGEAAQFAEYWSFIRARGSATKPGASGLIEGNCPNCGAPIAINQGAKCEYCQAVLRSGQYDWVLAEITQEEEWHPSDIPPPGAQQIRESDPGFNLQDLEDTASVIFWRQAAADRLGRIDPMRKVATPEWCDAYAARLQAATGLPARGIFCDCSVSAVDTLGVILGETENRALVEVCWMGRRFEAARSGELRDLRGEMIIQHSLFVLRRNAGVTSIPDHSISSAHCPSCGGAVSADTSNACEFCHAVLNDGTQSWVLCDIHPSDSREARACIAQAVAGSRRASKIFRALGSPASSGGTGALKWMIHSVVTTGSAADPSIRAMLKAVGQKTGLSADRVDELVRSAAAGQMDIPKPKDAEQARAWLLDMAVAAQITGGISKQEEALIRTVAKSQGLTAAAVEEDLKRARQEAFLRAKAELRSAKAARQDAFQQAKADLRSGRAG